MKIVVTSPSFSKNEELRAELLKYFPESRFNSEGKSFQENELVNFIGDAVGWIVGLERVSDSVLSQCPNLKIISKYGVGLDNVDTEACSQRGIRIGWTGGVNKLSVSEMTLGFMLALSRNLFQSAFLLKNGTWNKSGGFQLSGKTVGIIGVGHVGKEVIRLLKPFNCNILVNDIVEQGEYYRINNLREVGKEELFKQADIVTVHTPLSESTRNMVGTEVFKLMKPGAFLINTSRGGIVDESALKEALLSKKIAGAALDVYEVEPPGDNDLLKLPNLITTPHIGGNAREAVMAMGLSAIHHLNTHFGK